MLASFLSLAFIMSPPAFQANGVYCDEIFTVIDEYQEETGAFSEEDLERLLGRCERWEENDESL